MVLWFDRVLLVGVGAAEMTGLNKAVGGLVLRI